MVSASAELAALRAKVESVPRKGLPPSKLRELMALHKEIEQALLEMNKKGSRVRRQEIDEARVKRWRNALPIG